MTTEQSWQQVRDLIRADALRYVYYATQGETLNLRLFLGALVRNPGLRATVLARALRQLNSAEGHGVALRLAALAVRVLNELHKIVYGISLSTEADFGPGLYVAHWGGIWVGVTRTGPNCNIGQGVTMGYNGEGPRRGLPELGARVQVGPGAMIFGPLQVGDDAVVGANSVVTRSVPARGVAVGVPAVVRSARGSFDLIRYPGWDRDAERSGSQQLARSEAPAGEA